jgi:uncharacterized protein with von Willebrand factor type A (vWA) domain
MAADAVNGAQVANDQGALNYKIFSDVPIAASNLSVQNAVSAQQRVNDGANAVHENAMNAAQQIAQLAAQQALQMSQNGAMLAQAMTGRVSRHILDLSAEQATAFAKELSADLASRLAEMSGQLASVQEMAKIAQTTPPQTGTGGAFGSDAGSAVLQQLANIEALLRAQQSKG